MRHSTLRQLEVFEAIARLKSFTRAAEELFLTQPTVSMQIKKLTKEIGLPLFEQIGKKIYLTDTGKELYQTCLGIFEHISRYNNSDRHTMSIHGQMYLCIKPPFVRLIS